MRKIRIKEIILSPLSIIYSIFYKRPFVMSDVETIEYIIKHECSVSRFGDGEMDILLNSDIKFQKYSRDIKKALVKVNNAESSNLLICVPYPIINVTKQKENLTREAYMFWKRKNFLTVGWYYKYFSKINILGDTNFTRFYIDNKNKDRTLEYINKLKMIWDNKKVIFVEGNNTKLGEGNDLFSNVLSIKKILCPDKNAFSEYEKIKKEVINNYNKDDIVICSLGPTATVLAYDLCVNHSIRAIDLGHIDIEYEWFLRKTSKKIKIEGKNIIEV